MTALPTTGLDVVTLAQRLLAYTVAFADEAGVELPARRYVAPGDSTVVAWDCEQLVVTMAGIAPGAGTTTPVTAVRSGSPSSVGLRHVTLAVQLVRCTGEFGDGLEPADMFPDPAVIQESGLQMMQDAGLLSQVTANLAAGADSVFAAAAGGGLVTFGEVIPFGPAGCFWGLTATLSVTIGLLLP